MDYADIALEAYHAADSDHNVVSKSLAARTKRPFLAADASVESRTALQHCDKRRHFVRRRRRRSSMLKPSNEELNTNDESSGSVYQPRKSFCERDLFQQPRTPQRKQYLGRLCKQNLRRKGSGYEKSISSSFPALAQLTQPVANRATVFKQQRWKGEIIGEKFVRQERGRPRKQYFIEWKPSWVDSDRLTAPALIEGWEKSKGMGAERGFSLEFYQEDVCLDNSEDLDDAEALGDAEDSDESHRPRPGPVIVDEKGPQWEVSEILHIHRQRGQIKARAAWIGWEADCKWYPLENFRGAPCALLDYYDAHPDAPKPSWIDEIQRSGR